MKTSEIETALKKQHNFLGVYPRDLLPKFVDDCLLICNTDVSKDPGEHWVAIKIKNDIGEYFDPFGLPPLHSEIMNFLGRNCSLWCYNTVPVQGVLSTNCGLFCVAFVQYCGNDWSLSSFLNKFSTHTQFNDKIVKKLVKKNSKLLFSYHGRVLRLFRN